MIITRIPPIRAAATDTTASLGIVAAAAARLSTSIPAIATAATEAPPSPFS